MKKIFIAVISIMSFLLSSCTMYKPIMSEPSQNPVGQKLPKMDIEFYANNVKGANVDFIKNIVRNEITHNIISDAGVKRGTIEVNCEKIFLKQNQDT